MARMRCMDYGECKNTSSALIQIFVTLLLKDLDTRNFKGWKSENYSSLQKNDKKIMSWRQRASTKLLNKRSLCMLLAYNCILNIWLRVICSLHTHSQKKIWIVYSTWLINDWKRKREQQMIQGNTKNWWPTVSIDFARYRIESWKQVHSSHTDIGLFYIFWSIYKPERKDV